MAECCACGKLATVGFYRLGDLDSVYHICSDDCLMMYCTFVGVERNISATTVFKQFTKIDPEDYTAYCAMEVL
jgi:hypothetical protein